MSLFIGLFAGLLAGAFQEEPQAEAPVLRSSYDTDSLGACLNGVAGITGVIMQCTVDAEGRGRNCEIQNPTPAVMRREYVFQCMAARMRFSYDDGSSPEGVSVRFRVGGRTVLKDEDRQAPARL